MESFAGGIILVESSCYPRHQGLLSVSWWNYSGGIMLVESYWWNHELVELFWWYHTGGITTFAARRPEPHPHVPLTQIWLRDMNFSTRLSAIHFAALKNTRLNLGI